MAAACKALGCDRTTIGLNVEKLVLGLIYITDMEADEKTVLERRQKILGAIKGMEEYLETFKNLVGGSFVGYPLPTERLVPAR